MRLHPSTRRTRVQDNSVAAYESVDHVGLNHEFALTTDGVTPLLVERLQRMGIPNRTIYGPRHYLGAARITTTSDGLFEFHEDGEFADRDRIVAPDVEKTTRRVGLGEIPVHEPPDAFRGILDIQERAGLLSVPVYQQRPAAVRLPKQARHHRTLAFLLERDVAHKKEAKTVSDRLALLEGQV